MGSNSRGKDGEGSSGMKRVEDDDNYEYDEQEMNFVPSEVFFHSNMNTNGFVVPLVQSPLQVPVFVMQRPGLMTQPQPPPQALVQNGYVETVVHERLKSVRITWNHAGTNVAIAGSWNNWETTEVLQNVGQHFVIVKTLPISIYHYRFIVDGYLTHAPEFPSALHDSGYVYNILDLQDYIPVARSDTDDPSSPPSSYDNIFLNEDEFNKPPPELPPQLPVTVRQEASMNDTDLVPTITHLELNHLFINKSDGDQYVALRSTHRFQQKYVSSVLYKSLGRER